jgi:hypothetical protein
VGEAAVDALDDVLGRNPALAQGLEAHEGLRVVDPAAKASTADESCHALDGGIGQDRPAEGLNLRLHHLERRALVAADETAQLTGVLIGQEALRGRCRARR